MKTEDLAPNDDFSSTSGMHTVFVYGTLRKGQVNSHLLHVCQFLGRAKTKAKYALYAREIPFLSRTKEVSPVVGEVYAVDDNTLERLDELEKHPRWYRREKAEIILEERAMEMTAWIYFCDVQEGELELIESGDFLGNDRAGGA